MTADADRRTQLLRGTVDMCLLAALARRPTHAYDLVQQLERLGLTGVGYGTVYPLVGRLRRLGLVSERAEPSPSGPPRKVFEVTPEGARTLATWTSQWLETSAAVTGLLATAGALGATSPPSPPPTTRTTDCTTGPTPDPTTSEVTDART
ncbi:PadR family transcriptional regulator [Pseudokineococcus sp. 1T1Z-3]|uniref:PadR family transcriptional regulator n=1 Tax=Pseudokineococcus sp. 1T1Z-3 TaxID=3132745 RepID=UPI0030ADC7F4